MNYDNLDCDYYGNTLEELCEQCNIRVTVQEEAPEPVEARSGTGRKILW